MTASGIMGVIRRFPRSAFLSTLSILLIPTLGLPVSLRAADSPLLHSTFVGQTDFDEVRALAIGPDGRIFAVSSTRNILFPFSSEDFNIMVNAYDPAFQDAVPMMIFGGTRRDEVYAATFGDDGALYVCGTTMSPDLPVTPGCYDGSFGGLEDVFVAKISTDPLQVEAVTYLGSTGTDRGHSIAVGPGGDIYVSGSTTSATFPTTAGAYDRTYNGTDHACGGDMFIARFSPDLSTLNSSTFLGGSGLEACDHSGKIAISESGDVFVAGMTSSVDFPTTPGAFDQSYNGGWIDIFVSRMDPDLSTLVASTLYGGSADEMVYGFVAGNSNDLFFSAHVTSTDLPVSAGAVDAGPRDDYLARLDDDLTTVLSATYLGAYPYSVSQMIVILPGGDLVTAGMHSAPNYPVTPGSFDETFNGEVDGFLTRLNPEFTEITASTHLGSGGNDAIRALVIDGDGRIICGGNTDSPDFPVTGSADKPSYIGGEQDGFLSVFTHSLSYDTTTVATFLSDFLCKQVGDVTQISWRTSVDAGVDEFLLEKEYAETINEVPIEKTGWRCFEATDSDQDPARNGNTTYRLYSLEDDGSRTLIRIESVGSGTPDPRGMMLRSWPNPFNPNTTISFHLDDPADVRIEIFDTRGGLVRVVEDRFFGAGGHSARWDGRESEGLAVPSGLYFLRVTAGKQRESRKLVLLR